MEDEIGALIGIVLGVVAIAFVIYCIVILAGILAGVFASVAGAGGVVWGGGTAIVNYGKSFKENMIDSNRAAA